MTISANCLCSARLDDEKGFRKRKQLVSRTITVPKKNGASKTVARTYERAAEHLKVCFVDMPLSSQSFWTSCQGVPAAEDPTPTGSVPLTTVKCLAWNPNLGFSTAIAACGASGLCRILVLRGLENEHFSQVKSDILASVFPMNGDPHGS